MAESENIWQAILNDDLEAVELFLQQDFAGHYWNEFRDHKKKFEKALSNLPLECKVIHVGEKEGDGRTARHGGGTAGRGSGGHAVGRRPQA